MSIYDSLNPQQRKAVFSTSQYLRIIAGAGSGKTRVLTLRLVHMILDLGYLPHRLLAITFTNKAANEMKTRITSILEDQARSVWISTIHSLCVRILREDIAYLNYPKNFTVIDGVDQRAILKEAYKLMEIDSKQFSYGAMLGYISANKGAEVIVERAYILAGNHPGEKLKAEVYEYYEQQLRKIYALDFDDLILYTIRLFKANADVNRKWQRRFDAICVDEFQDIDHQQYELIRLLTDKETQLFVVGDPDQTIYTWRGADVNIIMDFEKRFKPTETVVLNQNYRSTLPILKGANALIRNNEYRVEKDLFTEIESEDKIIHIGFQNSESEANWVVGQIRRLVDEGQDYADIAVLYRANYLSRAIEKSLNFSAIPYVIYGGIRFYERMEVKDTISFLRLLTVKDDLSFRRATQAVRRGIGNKTLEEVSNLAAQKEITMYEVCKHHIDHFSGRARNTLSEFMKVLETIETQAKDKSIAETIAVVLDYSGIRASLTEAKETERLENVKELISDATSFEELNPEASLEEYLQMVSLYGDTDQDDASVIRLMTVHSAKGLEFETVFVIGMSEGIFPNDRALSESGKRGMEEERRLAYVAMTRAKSRLYLTESSGFSFVSNRVQSPSRFLEEIDEEHIIHQYVTNYGQVQEKEKATVDDFTYKKQHPNQRQRYQKGALVLHTVFGEGYILAVEASFVKIAFNHPFGIKNIALNHPSITLITKETETKEEDFYESHPSKEYFDA